MADPGGVPASRRLELWMAGYGTRSSAGPRAGSIGVTTITADCSWRPRDVVRLEGSAGGERASPRDGGSALSRSASVAAGGPPRPVEPAPPSARSPPAPPCLAVIATVMASRDVTA